MFSKAQTYQILNLESDADILNNSGPDLFGKKVNIMAKMCRYIQTCGTKTAVGKSGILIILCNDGTLIHK